MAAQVIPFPIDSDKLTERQALTEARKLVDSDGVDGLIVIWTDGAGMVRCLSGKMTREGTYWTLAMVQKWLMEGCP